MLLEADHKSKQALVPLNPRQQRRTGRNFDRDEPDTKHEMNKQG